MGTEGKSRRWPGPVAPPEEPGEKTAIVLKDQDGTALAHQRYLIVLNDGSEHSGMTDKDGKVELELPSDGKIYFPELSDVQ